MFLNTHGTFTETGHVLVPRTARLNTLTTTTSKLAVKLEVN